MCFSKFPCKQITYRNSSPPGHTRQKVPLAFGEIGGLIWSSSAMKVTSIMKTEYPTISCNQIRQTRGGGGGGEESCAHSFDNLCEYQSTPKTHIWRHKIRVGGVGWGGAGSPDFVSLIPAREPCWGGPSLWGATMPERAQRQMYGFVQLSAFSLATVHVISSPCVLLGFPFTRSLMQGHATNPCCLSEVLFVVVSSWNHSVSYFSLHIPGSFTK